MKHNLAVLSFAVVGREGQIVSLWKSVPEWQYQEACCEGRRRADEVVRLMERDSNPTLLGHIVTAIVESSDRMGGLEIGFFSRIAALAIEGVLLSAGDQLDAARPQRPKLHLAVDNQI